MSAFTQIGLHGLTDEDVKVRIFELEDEPRRAVSLGPITVYGDPAVLLAAFEAVVAKIREGFEVVETTEPEAPTPYRVLARGEVLARLRADYTRQFPTADSFSESYVDHERRKVLDDLNRLGLAVFEVGGVPEGLRGDRTFSLSHEVTVHQADGTALVIEADGILASQAGDGHAVVTGRILRHVNDVLATNEPLPPSVAFTEPERIHPEADPDGDIAGADYPPMPEPGTQPTATAPFEDEGGPTDA